MVTAEAHIATMRAGEYLRKLCRHVERAAQSHSDGPLRVECSDSQGAVGFGRGRCALQATPDALILRAEAADEEGLGRLETLIAERLETFGSGERLKVTWGAGQAPE